MKRRDFLGAVATAMVAAGARVPLSAQQSRPKIMLFGLTAVMQNGSGIRAVLPAVSNHGAFISGPAALVRKLANGGRQVSGPDSGVGQGHPDLGLRGTELACLGEHAVTAGSGPASFGGGLDAHLPNVPQLASQIQPGPDYAFGPYPTGSIMMSLNGGTLRLPGTPSNNAGTHNVLWQFQHEGRPVGADYALTDLLIFESQTPTLEIAIGPSTATLGAGEALWFVNIPTFGMNDTSVDTIEHANDWFSFLNAPVQGKIWAVAKTTFKRATGNVKFQHPCAGVQPRLAIQPGVTAKYFPPDTDPCFIVRA